MQSPDTIQKLAFDGPFTTVQLVAIGIVIAVVTALFTWRDCKAASSLKIFALLFLSRSVALCVALWMLAGATLLTLLQREKSRSIVMIVDASGSMDSVDPVDGSGNNVNWDLENHPTIKTLNQAIGRLRAAQSSVGRIRKLIQSGDGAGRAQAAWDDVITAITAAAVEIEGPNVDSQTRAELKRTADLLRNGAAPLRGRRIDSGRAGREQANDRLDEAEALVIAGQRRVSDVCERLSVQIETAPGPQQRMHLATQSRIPRKDKVAAWLESGEETWIGELEEKQRVLRYTFTGRVSPVPSREWRNTLRNAQPLNVTDLVAALDRAALDAAKHSVDAIVIVTDGGHNAAGDPRDAAASLRGVPLYVVPIGDSKMPRDVILHHTHAPRAVFKNDNVIIEAMVTAFDCEGETLAIELLTDGTVIDSQTNTVTSAVFDQRIRFHRKATELGRQKFQVRAVPIREEHSTDNNSAHMEVEVMEDMIRVLVADDRPRWEFRYLVALFKRDRHVEFDQLLFDPVDASSGARPSFPTDPEGWRKYRVVVLGDVTPGQLTRTQQEMLKKYVTEDGGNLIVIAGETSMPDAFADEPLGSMIPVIPGDAVNEAVSLTVTAEGNFSIATQLEDDPLSSERIWREMSLKIPIYLPVSVTAKPTSHTLIAATASGSARQQAFLSWQYVGLGRVIYVAAPVTYQLRYRNGDRYHHRFWGQMLRWAIAREMSGGSRTVRITTDKAGYEQGDPAQVTLRMSDLDGKPVGGEKVSIQTVQGERIVNTLELREEPESTGTYSGTLNDLPLGQVILRAAGNAVDVLLASEGRREPAEQLVSVDPKGSVEQNSPVCNLALLNRIADASGGAVLSPGAVPAALSTGNAPAETQQAVLRREPVWNRWSYLWIFLGCVTIEWLARKYWRMV